MTVSTESHEDPAVAWEAWLNEPIARWTCTRGELIDALTHLQAAIPWPPPIQPDGTIYINAESMADAILGGLTPAPTGHQVTVSALDLAAVLGEAEGFIGGKDNAAFTRLAEAAGVS
jgi:hypothetical protein